MARRSLWSAEKLEWQSKTDYSRGSFPVKSEYTSTRQSMHLRAHHHYMLTLHTYLLHISFHKEFLIGTGSCFLWNLVLHHTLLQLLQKKKKNGCFISNSSNHVGSTLTLNSNRALHKLCISDAGSRALHYFVLPCFIYFSLSATWHSHLCCTCVTKTQDDLIN